MSPYDWDWDQLRELVHRLHDVRAVCAHERDQLLGAIDRMAEAAEGILRIEQEDAEPV